MDTPAEKVFIGDKKRKKKKKSLVYEKDTSASKSIFLMPWKIMYAVYRN